MWLLADLFEELPEVGDVDKPKLVFFFDEAHLLFDDASKEFLDAIAQTVRLIRSKGVGVFFVTQTPKDVPSDVLAQLGNRVQHALRAFTPDDAKALKATVSTFPNSSYDLEETLTQLGIGEAVVTVLSDRGAPTPVAWTRLRAPQSMMAPADPALLTAAVAASPLHAEVRRAGRPRVGVRAAGRPAREATGGRGAEHVDGEGAAGTTRTEGTTGTEAGEVDGREGARVLGVQAGGPVGGRGDRPRDHPVDLRHPPPLTRRVAPVGVGRGVGGGCEIRTREGVTPTRFPSVRTRPLCESSAAKRIPERGASRPPTRSAAGRALRLDLSATPRAASSR